MTPASEFPTPPSFHFVKGDDLGPGWWECRITRGGIEFNACAATKGDAYTAARDEWKQVTLRTMTGETAPQLAQTDNTPRGARTEQITNMTLGAAIATGFLVWLCFCLAIGTFIL